MNPPLKFLSYGFCKTSALVNTSTCQESGALQFHRDRCPCTWDLSRTHLCISSSGCSFIFVSTCNLGLPWVLWAIMANYETWEGTCEKPQFVFIFLNFICFNKNCIYLSQRTWFDIHIHSEIVKLINISPHIVTIFFLVKRSLLKSITSKFSVLNMVL